MKIKFFTGMCLFFFSYTFVYACAGCDFASTYGTVTKGYKNAASDVSERFDELEEAFSDKYEEDILPLVETIRDMEEEIKVTSGQLEALQKIRLLYEIEIVQTVKEIKSIDESIDFTREQSISKGVIK